MPSAEQQQQNPWLGNCELRFSNVFQSSCSCLYLQAEENVPARAVLQQNALQLGAAAEGWRENTMDFWFFFFFSFFLLRRECSFQLGTSDTQVTQEPGSSPDPVFLLDRVTLNTR